MLSYSARAYFLTMRENATIENALLKYDSECIDNMVTLKSNMGKIFYMPRIHVSKIVCI